MEPAVPNFLTFDVEEWYHANYEGLNFAGDVSAKSNLERLMERLIGLCAEAGIRCTCFVLGSVAEKHPGLVRRLHEAGHEVASHGYAHKPVHLMAPDEFKADLARSCGLLSSLTGEPVLGFRAPSFSVNKDNLPWFYQTLEEAGLRYSSSVFPGRTFLYGIPGFPDRIHRPGDSGWQTSILEFPISRLTVFGKALPLYVRLFPAWALRRRVVAENRRARSVMLYAHPREIDPDQPRLPLSRMQGLIHYWGIGTCEAKLRALTLSLPGRFTRIRDALEPALRTG